MTGPATVCALCRHPIKGLGSEALDSVDLTAGAPMPMDRAFALLHAGGEDHDGWQRRRNFLVVAHGPDLARIAAKVTAVGAIVLSHPSLEDLTLRGTEDSAALVEWVLPLWPAEMYAPLRLVKAPASGMADHEPAQVSILSASSLRALSQRAGMPLDQRRFRGNIWIDGLAPWEEFDLVDRTIRIGGIAFEITDRIDRCRATEANPETGKRDVNVQKVLPDGYDHKDFGVLATVKSSGTLRVGDVVELG